MRQRQHPYPPTKLPKIPPGTAVSTVTVIPMVTINIKPRTATALPTTARGEWKEYHNGRGNHRAY